jgi:hypothetical protein
VLSVKLEAPPEVDGDVLDCAEAPASPASNKADDNRAVLTIFVSLGNPHQPTGKRAGGCIVSCGTDWFFCELHSGGLHPG